jgi:hypothetical protein
MEANGLHSLCQNRSRIGERDGLDRAEIQLMEFTATQGTVQRHLIARNYFYESFSCLAPSTERLAIAWTHARFLSNRWLFS